MFWNKMAGLCLGEGDRLKVGLHEGAFCWNMLQQLVAGTKSY